MGFKTPGTASCESLSVLVKMPQEAREKIELSVETEAIDVRSPRWERNPAIYLLRTFVALTSSREFLWQFYFELINLSECKTSDYDFLGIDCISKRHIQSILMPHRLSGTATPPRWRSFSGLYANWTTWISNQRNGRHFRFCTPEELLCVECISACYRS